jgi:hypothetical protein
MSDLLGKYAGLRDAYEKALKQADGKQVFETQWRTIYSMTMDAKDKGTAIATAPVKNMQTLTQPLAESFSKESDAKCNTARKLLEKMPAAFAPRASQSYGGTPHTVTDPPAIPQEPVPPVASAQPKPPAGQCSYKFCPNCGKQISVNAVFCRNCGAKQR